MIICLASRESRTVGAWNATIIIAQHKGVSPLKKAANVNRLHLRSSSSHNKLKRRVAPEQPLENWCVDRGVRADIVLQALEGLLSAWVLSIGAREEICAVRRIQACAYVCAECEVAAVRPAVKAPVDKCTAAT